MARLIPAGGGGLPVGVPLHLPVAELPKNTALLDGSPMPAWASSRVKAMYGDTLPDYRGRTPVGTDEGSGRVSAAWARTPGGAGGRDTHALSVNEMPAHNHAASTGSAGSHSHSGSASSAGSHSHISQARPASGGAVGLSTTQSAGAHNVSGSWANSRSVQNANAGAHTHSLSINSNGAHTHSVSVSNRGGNAAHNNMQPSIAGRWVMRLK